MEKIYIVDLSAIRQRYSGKIYLYSNQDDTVCVKWAEACILIQ